MNIYAIRRANLQALIDRHAGGNAAEFARLVERERSQIGQYLSATYNQGRSIGERVARSIEEKLSIPTGYLDKNLSHSVNKAGYTTRLEPNTAEGPVMRTRVPLISWVQAGHWCEAIDPFAPGDAEDWLFCPANHSSSTFALRVRGVSMEPKYRDGAIIYVDPERSADHLSNVIVRMEDEAEVTFKQLVIEGEKRFLRPLNPDWPGPKLISIDSDAVICGVVIGQFIED